MRRILFTLAVVSLGVSALVAQGQDNGPAPLSIPVAGRSQSDCTGFIASPPLPHDLFVVGGADDDFHSVSRQFIQGESIFISKHRGGDVAVGSEFSVVRTANELFRTMRYQGERGEINSLGQPYEDVAQVRVTHVNPDGVVARVTFSCGPIMPGDMLVPFQPRAVPMYAVTAPLDHFAPLDSSKQHGRITASHNNFGFFGRANVVYVNLGESQGTLPGQRLRIYKVLPPHTTGFGTSESTPPETIGEAVVLSVQSKSCVAMIVSSYREISAGDYIEKE